MQRSILASWAAFAWVLTAHSAWAQGGYTVVGGGNSPPTGTGVVAIEPGGVTPGGSAVISPRGRRSLRDRRPEEYGGVTPGSPQLPPGMRRLARQRANPRAVSLVAWPGFQMVPGGSRVFLAVTTQPTITVTRTNPREIVYRLEHARINLWNNHRPLETGAFATPLERAFVRQRGPSVELVLQMRADVEPHVTQETNAQQLNFVYIDLPPYAGAMPRLVIPGVGVVAVQPQPPGAPVPSGAPNGPGIVIDREQPPPVIR